MVKVDFNEFLAKIGERQTSFARKLNIPQQRVNEWCRGLSFPSFKQLLKIAQAGYSLDEIFGIQKRDNDINPELIPLLEKLEEIWEFDKSGLTKKGLENYIDMKYREYLEVKKKFAKEKEKAG